MSELDAFKGCEDTVGVTVWRIENFKPVKQPSSKAGRFSKGDSYIVLNVIQRANARAYHIHFWLGKETTRDESGTAAYLAASLDEILGGKPVQFREIQDEESDAFLQMFKHGVQYEEGGVASGFNPSKPEEYKTRLLHIRGHRGVRVAEVPVEVASMNHGDCFVLDDGLELFQWNGEEASRGEKAKALSVTSAIRNEDRNGKALVHVLNDGDYESENAKHFFGKLGVPGATAASVKIASAVTKEKSDLFKPAKLFKHEAGVFNEIASSPGGFHKSSLVSDAIFVLNSGGKVYIWIGIDVPPDDKKKAMEIGTTFIEKQGLPTTSQIQILKENLENAMFKDAFQRWDHVDLEQKMAKVTDKEEKAKVDIDAMVSGLTANVSKELQIDDGHGSLEIWRIENFELVAWPEDLYGQFYSGDSFVVKYTYKKYGSESCILYFWQGRDSSTDEKGASAVLAAQLDEELGGAPAQVRIVQNKEPNHFHQIFKGVMIVHLGGLNNADEGKEGPNGEKLYQVKGYKEIDTHAVQVRTKFSSLNSGDSFILLTSEEAIVWQGKLCSDSERSFASSMGKTLAGSKPITTVEEGSEEDAFWEHLGGKGDYPQVGELPPPEQLPRLFHINDSVTGGHGVAVNEVLEFDQEDLSDEDVMLLDTFKEIFVWIGLTSRENEKEEGLELARKYLAELNKLNARDLQTPISLVFSGKEPPTFTCYFLGWDDTRTAEFADPYKAKLEKMKEQQEEDSEWKKKAEERRKKFVDPKASKPQAAEPSTPPAEAKSAKPDKTEPVECHFKPLVDFFSLDEIKGMKASDGIDVTCKEDYLSDADFESVFKMKRAEFKDLAVWRQRAKKQELGLF